MSGAAVVPAPSAPPALRVEGLAKKYCRSFRRGVAYWGLDLLRGVAGRPMPGHLRPDEFWALSDVSFEVQPGECLGLVGANGAGKSTLLKVLTGILEPTQGRVEVRGRVGALIELGAGFHPDLTGRENIYINGAILGLTRKEIDARFGDIVEFAGVGEFLDTPVRFYSSGMYVRLGFAVAAHTRPDVLLIDEVLAVGDVPFQNRCYERVRRFLDEGCAAVLVSHNPLAIRRFCRRALWLRQGQAARLGEAAEVLQEYELQDKRPGVIRHPADPVPWPGMEDGPVRVLSLALEDEHGAARELFRPGERLRVRLGYEVTAEQFKGVFWVDLIRQDGVRAMAFTSPRGEQAFVLPRGKGELVLETSPLHMIPGVFAVNTMVWDEAVHGYLYYRNGPRFSFVHPQLDERWGVVETPATWQVLAGRAGA